jgi:predicted membrane channel-forming protein YqfA (hemolysin III family)
MHQVIYALCAATAAACAVLLLRGYLHSRHRLLLWSGLSFVGLTVNSLLLVIDRLVVPEIDMSMWRLWIALGAMALLLFSLILESTQPAP